MIDPAIFHDLQRAMISPSMPPLAIVREWQSPMAEAGQRELEPVLVEKETQAEHWRANLRRFDVYFSSLRDLVWSDEDLGNLDVMIRSGERRAEKSVQTFDRTRQKVMRFNRQLARTDPSAASVHKRQWARLEGSHSKDVEVFREVLTKLRALRAHVDTRSGAEPGYIHRQWTPNVDTVAAMERARAGELETVTLEDLRAAIFADD